MLIRQLCCTRDGRLAQTVSECVSENMFSTVFDNNIITKMPIQRNGFVPSCKTLFSSQSSSICKAAIHAGVIGADGGLVDVLPLDKKKSYVGVLKNGIQSERYCSVFCGRIISLRGVIIGTEILYVFLDLAPCSLAVERLKEALSKNEKRHVQISRVTSSIICLAAVKLPSLWSYNVRYQQ